MAKLFTQAELDLRFTNTLKDIERTMHLCIEENLRDPDLMHRSEDYKAGYRRGFTEVTFAQIERLKHKIKTTDMGGKE